MSYCGRPLSVVCRVSSAVSLNNTIQYKTNNVYRSSFKGTICWFKLIYTRSIAKQVIPTYINHSRPLIPDGIHLFFLNEVLEEREARPVLICWAPSKEASGTIFITSFVWRGRGSNPRPPAHGANALTTEPKYNLTVCIIGLLSIKLFFFSRPNY